MRFENQISYSIIASALNIHKQLGPGLLESAYRECLHYSLVKKGLFVEKEKPMPVIFEEVKMNCGYRIDLLVEKSVMVELKSVEALHDVHLAQILTYLRLGEFKLGLLINFNVSLLKDGIRRVINSPI